MAENRYIYAVVNNKTDTALEPSSSHLSWGKFNTVPIAVPAHRIDNPAFQSSGAAGSATGTEGWVKYDLGGETITISWDVPYTGANSFKISASGDTSVSSDGSDHHHCNGCTVKFDVG